MQPPEHVQYIGFVRRALVIKERQHGRGKAMRREHPRHALAAGCKLHDRHDGELSVPLELAQKREIDPLGVKSRAYKEDFSAIGWNDVSP
ncbi:hypothetical protein BVG81_007385 [Haliangium sp. UPWRP_2]|nr:hypothetical protein BVG81_007385 [Haliangium sp. UPWRP_2]